jgi:predicted nucleotidyltransferase component of viral defense system
MLPADQIRVLAGQAGVDPGILEKDYVLSKALMALATLDDFQRTLVFKGGTALKKFFYPQWRYSEDLDFTSRTPMDNPSILAMFERAIPVTTDLFGLTLRIIEYSQYPQQSGPLVSAQLKIGYDGPLRKSSGQKNNVRIDIAFDENISGIPQFRKVFNAYTDDVEAEVPVYSLEEIVAEKLRSILQRGKSRDYFDVWVLLRDHRSDFSQEQTHDILRAKCDHRGIRFPTVDDFLQEDRVQEATHYWERGLAHQMTSLPRFETMLSELRQLLDEFITDTHA